MSVSSLEDIKGLGIVYVRHGFKDEFIEQSELNFTYLANPNWIEMGIKMMTIGRVDASYSLSINTHRYLIDHLGYSDDVKLIPLPARADIYSAFNVKLGAEIVDRYNEVLNELGGQDRYFHYLKRYVGEDQFPDSGLNKPQLESTQASSDEKTPDY